MHAKPTFLALVNLPTGKTTNKVSMGPNTPANRPPKVPLVGESLTPATTAELPALVETITLKVAVAESNKNVFEGREQVACRGAPEHANDSWPRNPLFELT
jgi:hypothetical protein